MRAREYEVLHRAVEEGVASGWRRAFKHTAKPAEADAHAAIADAVVTEICEWFTFAPTGEDATGRE